MDLSVDLYGRVLEHPIMNAAGTVKVLSDVENMARRASVSVIMVGSITVDPEAGCSGKTYHRDHWFSLNSWGLPNPGMNYYEANLYHMGQAARAEDKKLAVSIAGSSVDDYQVLAEMVSSNSMVDILEVNLGCPNAWSASGQRKPIASFRPSFIRDILRRVAKAAGPTGPLIWAKVSPFSNPLDLVEFVWAVKEVNSITGVTACNTFPDGSAFDAEGNPAIDANDGFAGVSGPALKPIALGQTRHLSKLLPKGVSLIGAGGVATGKDAKDFLAAGSLVVQIGTAFLRDTINLDYNVFGRVLDELTDILG